MGTNAAAEGLSFQIAVSAPATNPQPARTVLPRPFAQAVSLATRTTCLAIRASSTVGSYGFDAAKLASLSSLELGRSMVEGILSRAGSQVLSRSKTELSRDETESILESSLANLHRAMSKAVFWTAAGFELTGSTFSIASGVSQLVLSTLDQFFGSTDSSRAIASIITLIRREFQNPATGADGERVGVTDLVIGLCALAILQRSCRKSVNLENERLGHLETVWDVVVLRDGERVDIQDSDHAPIDKPNLVLHTSPPVNSAVMHSIGQHGSTGEGEDEGSSCDEENMPEIRLRKQIMQSLPAHASAAISTSVRTTKTITVDITGPEIPMLTPPPGVHIVEETHTHHDIRSFVHHTESKAESILLTSFVDTQGGSDSTGSTNTGVPLVHYISLDHESKAVVLACRGTLGFEDVLADMTCDYDELMWGGKAYKVHKGIHASARRLLYGGDGRVLLTLKEALDEFQDYGLVLCGHSLGGGVTALLGIMLSEPNPRGTGFVTSAEPHTQLHQGAAVEKHPGAGHVCLPSGRPIHVYAYGPPGTVSPSLRKGTRGLITTVVQGNDLVPYLSLGVLHDLQAVALAFKNDKSSAKAEIGRRVWKSFQSRLAEKWYHQSSFAKPRNDEWDLSILKMLRSNMIHEKLLPPGEVFCIESTRVLRRDAFVRSDEDHIGRPAKRAILKYIKDVESHFMEAKFGTSMLLDHSPAMYEDALNTLRLGVAGSDLGW
ncbi:hypothetical protein jhhlp_000564 [Lomentospora prolificans]|uniref:sn-1-specific diacylglycerol lipase n=1 Tax=Lomentospora prolificans TaxID=41688 RepID=A0A2N3NLD6_9PEZI|nr:hypothetical protein jhhlp_000564 [Lomentospora prolificans]